MVSSKIFLHRAKSLEQITQAFVIISKFLHISIHSCNSNHLGPLKSTTKILPFRGKIESKLSDSISLPEIRLTVWVCMLNSKHCTALLGTYERANLRVNQGSESTNFLSYET